MSRNSNDVTVLEDRIMVHEREDGNYVLVMLNLVGVPTCNRILSVPMMMMMMMNSGTMIILLLMMSNVDALAVGCGTFITCVSKLF